MEGRVSGFVCRGKGCDILVEGFGALGEGGESGEGEEVDYFADEFGGKGCESCLKFWLGHFLANLSTLGVSPFFFGRIS